MPKVSEEYLEARRRGILVAAQRCVSRKGIQGTTMRDICRAANLSPGAVYRYFPSKDEILGALAELRLEQIRAFFRSLRRPLAADELARAVAQLAGTLDDPAALDGLRLDVSLWSRALQSDEVSRTLVPGLDAAIESVEAGLDGSNAPGTARIVVALLQGLALQKALDPDLDLATLDDALRFFLVPTVGPNELPPVR